MQYQCGGRGVRQCSAVNHCTDCATVTLCFVVQYAPAVDYEVIRGDYEPLKSLLCATMSLQPTYVSIIRPLCRPLYRPLCTAYEIL